MARRRKKRPQSPQGEDLTPAPATVVATTLGSLLKDVRVSPAGGAPKKPSRGVPGPKSPSRDAAPPQDSMQTPPAASSSHVPDARELRLLNDAYAGITPLVQTRVGKRARRKVPSGSPAVTIHAAKLQVAEDANARKRLGALVGGGVHFVQSALDDGLREAVRQGVASRELRRVRSPNFHPEATIDLHGETVDAVEVLLSRFVRNHHRRGCKYLLVIHGKGLHSMDGRGVLGDAAFVALTAGGAAPLVRVIAPAHAHLGGSGATAVMLM